MENIDSITAHFQISQAISIIIQILVLVACIIIVTKKKSTASYILLIGAILNLFSFFGYTLIGILPFDSQEAIIKMQIIVSYANTFAHAVFTLGLLLFVVNDLKNN